MSFSIVDSLEQNGYALMPGVLTPSQVEEVMQGLQAALNGSSLGPIRRDEQQIAASRNILNLWPDVLRLAHRVSVRPEIVELMGPSFGLVRVLYFDKLPGRSWGLPWHKDMTISVRDNGRGGEIFSKPTTKAGVPHVEAPVSVLENMLTARVHLDEVDDSNGPLLVMPGSHRNGKSCTAPVGESEYVAMHADPGDVLLMRPLITHCSRSSHPDATRHRRVVHLEFAVAGPLPDGYEWYDFRLM
jgi:hypothetical protein